MSLQEDQRFNSQFSIGALIENRAKEVGIAIFTGKVVILTQLINDS